MMILATNRHRKRQEISKLKTRFSYRNLSPFYLPLLSYLRIRTWYSVALQLQTLSFVCTNTFCKNTLNNINTNTPILLLGRLAFYLYYVRYSTTQQSRASLFSIALLLKYFLFTKFVPAAAQYLLLRRLGGGSSSIMTLCCQPFPISFDSRIKLFTLIFLILSSCKCEVFRDIKKFQ